MLPYETLRLVVHQHQVPSHPIDWPLITSDVLPLCQFHRSIPAHIYSYPIEIPDHAPPVPLRRYGFHGLSYSSILKKVANHLDKKEEQTSLIVCHLGSGASMACIKDGKSWDTTVRVIE